MTHLNGDKSLETASQLVINSLEDPRYDWRTIEGISKETGLSNSQILGIINGVGNAIVRSSIPDEEGRSLYTTRKHYKDTHSLGARILDALADKVA
jgi:hypothetical protein